MTALRRVLLPANAVSLLLAGLFLWSWAVVPSFEQVHADTLPSDRWPREPSCTAPMARSITAATRGEDPSP